VYFRGFFADLEVAICNLKIGNCLIPRDFDVFEVTICDLKQKQVTRESHLLSRSN
jgi:hypothetical protein